MCETEEKTQEQLTEPPIKILTVDGYFERFYEIASLCDSNKAAFELVETELRILGNTFGVEKRYSHYDSFKSAKYRFDHFK